MKAISLWQPWASAIALGLKHYETRGRSTAYRGPIAIHAAMKGGSDLKAVFDMLACRRDFSDAFYNAGLYNFAMLPKGAIVATAVLSAVMPTEALQHGGLVGDLERNLGDYDVNRFAWNLEQVRALAQPYFIAGRQGFFNVPEIPEEMFHEIHAGATI